MPRRSAPRLLAAALAGLALAAATSGPAPAQGTEITLGPLAQDASLPVEVTAERLEVDQDSGTAIFIGDVFVAQGEMRLGAGRIEVSYPEPGSDAPAITAMRASGGVTLASAAAAAQSREAVYDVEAGSLVMTGEVILTQGRAVISGDRLVVDLATGTGVMEGRVRTVFRTDDN